MFFNKKKLKKSMLPFAMKEEASEASDSQPSPRERSYNDAAEQFVPSDASTGGLKNYAIYYRDRDLALTKGDPMITIIQAYSHAEAQLEALKMQKDGCEILTIQSNEMVEHPTQDAVVALPARRVAGQGHAKSSGAGTVFRAKHNLMRGF
jgi:hypothetical protein